MSVTIPRSMRTSRPSSPSRMLPGCRSACTKPSTKTIFRMASPPTRASAFGSPPTRATSRGSVALPPATSSIPSTRREQISGKRRGTPSPGTPAKLAAKRRLFSASFRKSSWPRSASPKRAAAPGSERRRTDGTRLASRAQKPRMARLRSICASASGRWTFSATASPVSSRAPWTWATEAAAIGVGSIQARRARAVASSSAARTASTTAKGAGGTASWRRASWVV